MMNMILVLSFCAFEAVFAMLSGSHTLMLDFYARLAVVFAMVYSLEAVQTRSEVASVGGVYVHQSALAVINASTNPIDRDAKTQQAAVELNGADLRRRIIAAVLIGCYLLTVAFCQAMSNITSMYGGAPADVTRVSWVLGIAGLCLLLDLVHVYYGVEVELQIVQNTNRGFFESAIMASFGSLFVAVEAIACMTIGGGFVSPIVAIVYACAICMAATDKVTLGASALLGR